MNADPVITLGIDTGDTAGFGLAAWEDGQRRAVLARAWQCDRDSAVLLLGWILRDFVLTPVAAVQVAAFDDRPKSRGLHGTSPSLIRRQVTELERVCVLSGVPVHVRTASQVKTWAADARLTAAGLYAFTAGASMSKHARDAARHALFCAVHDCAVPDPLSRARTAAARAGRDVPG